MRLGRRTTSVLSVVIFFALWQCVSSLGLVNRFLFPPPTAVLHALVEMARSGELWRDVRTSLLRAVVGFVIGSVTGITVGLITGRIKSLEAVISPILEMFRPLPPVAIIPLVIVWFGIGEVSKVFSIAFAVFFPVWINTDLGARNVPRSFIWSAKTLGVVNPTLLWRVILPAAIPYIVGGLRVGISLTFVMVFVSELSGASVGLGYEISVSYLAYRVDRMIAALATLGFLGLACDSGMMFLLRRTMPWLTLDTAS